MNTFKRLQQSKRGGVSVVIAMIMAMAIVISLVTNVFLWEQSIQQEAQLRAAEKLAIDKIYTSSGVTHFAISNTGTVAIHLVGLWINQTRYTMNYRVNPAYSIDVAESLGLTEQSVFDTIIVTERGLKVAAKYSPEPTADVQATGVFKIDWFYLKYTSAQKTTKTDAKTIPSSSTYVALYLKLINNWIYTTKVKNISYVCWTVPMPEVYMFIVNNVSYGYSKTISAYTTDITISPGAAAELTFAASTKAGTTWTWGTSIPNDLINSNPSHTAALSISIYYEMNGEVFGQVLNAQGVYFP